MWRSYRMVLIALVIGVIGSIETKGSTGEDYVVVIAPSDDRVSLSSARLFSSTIVESLDLPYGRLLSYFPDEASPIAIKECLKISLLRSLKPQDLLVLYMACPIEVSHRDGISTRTYLTSNGTFSDRDLIAWLDPLQRKGVQVLIIRECHCLVHDPSRSGRALFQDVATYEVSSIKDIGHNSGVRLDDESPRIGELTYALCESMERLGSFFSLTELLAGIKDVEGVHESSELFELAGSSRENHEELSFGTDAHTLHVSAHDAIFGHPLNRAEIQIGGETCRAPADFQVSQNTNTHSILARMDGYIPNRLKVTPQDQDIDVYLVPQHALVKGRISTPGGLTPSGLRISYGFIGDDLPNDGVVPVFDAETVPKEDGSFTIRIPPGFVTTIHVFDGARVMVNRQISEEALTSSYTWNESTSTTEIRPYDLGAVRLTTPGAKPSLAEANFVRLLDSARDSLKKRPDAGPSGKGLYDEIRRAVAGLPEELRLQNERRVYLFERRLKPEIRNSALERTLGDLRKKITVAIGIQDLETAERLAEKAVLLNDQLGGFNPAPYFFHDEIRFARIQERFRGMETPRAKFDRSGSIDIEGFSFIRVNDGGSREYLHDQTGLEFVYIPAGEFTMGSPAEEKWHTAKEQKHVASTSHYLIAKYEVSQRVYEEIMRKNPSIFKKGGSYPVDDVSWFEAAEFCIKTNLQLPTEAQWERACRAGTNGPFAFGELVSRDQVNYGPHEEFSPFCPCRNQTVPVDLFAANHWGLFNMHGNVLEWCWGELLAYPKDNGYHPASEIHHTPRAVRGGAWSLPDVTCRSAFRFDFVAGYKDFGQVGFRPARSLELH